MVGWGCSQIKNLPRRRRGWREDGARGERIRPEGISRNDNVTGPKSRQVPRQASWFLLGTRLRGGKRRQLKRRASSHTQPYCGINPVNVFQVGHNLVIYSRLNQNKVIIGVSTDHTKTCRVCQSCLRHVIDTFIAPAGVFRAFFWHLLQVVTQNPSRLLY